MKKVALMIAMVGVLAVGTSFGQDTPPPPPPHHAERMDKSPEEMAEKKTERMKEELKLSDAQAEKIKALNEAHFEDTKQLHQQMRALKEEMKAKRKALHEDVDKVLTDEQRAIRDQKVAERKEKRKACKKECDRK